MCTRTKTSYGCGHSYKTTNECSSSRCSGLERFHFQHDGDCNDCRHLTKHGGAAVDRGKAGLGRYGKLLRGDHSEENHGCEAEPIREHRRGRSTGPRVATGAMESVNKARQVLRELRQQSTRKESKPPNSYRPVKSQPLNLKQETYTTSYTTSYNTNTSSGKDHKSHRATSTLPSKHTGTPAFDTSFASAHPVNSSFAYIYPKQTSNTRPRSHSKHQPRAQTHNYYPFTKDTITTTATPIIIDLEERTPANPIGFSSFYSSSSKHAHYPQHPHFPSPQHHKQQQPPPTQKKMDVRIREIFPDNRTGGWIYGEVEDVDDMADEKGNNGHGALFEDVVEVKPRAVKSSRSRSYR